MKKLSYLTAVSALALLLATPALAETKKDQMDKDYTQPGYQHDSRGNQGKSSDAPKTELKEAAAEADKSLRNTMDNIKAALIDDDADMKATPKSVELEKRMTADGMLGNAVVNEANDRVGTVEDVILNANGDATLIVVKDGDFAGFGGKLVAFDYDMVVKRQPDGDIVMPITEKSFDKVAEFSYDKSDKKDVRVIPANGYSMKEILKGNLVDPAGKKVAEIENVSLKNGKADLVIASYGEVLKMGGERVAIDFDTGRLVRDDDSIDLKLSKNQTARFESYKAANK